MTTHEISKAATGPHPGHWFEVLAVFTRLGLTSFGGPVAHLGYFREEFVTRRGWFDDRAYADLVALCQFLPGPASSQSPARTVSTPATNVVATAMIRAASVTWLAPVGSTVTGYKVTATPGGASATVDADTTSG